MAGTTEPTDLARRVAELERRVAELEQRPVAEVAVARDPVLIAKWVADVSRNRSAALVERWHAAVAQWAKSGWVGLLRPEAVVVRQYLEWVRVMVEPAPA